MASPNDFEVTRVILEAQRDVVTNLQTTLSKQVTDLVRGVIELRISEDCPCLRVDDCGLIGTDCGKVTGIHGGNGSTSREGKSKVRSLVDTVTWCMKSGFGNYSTLEVAPLR